MVLRAVGRFCDPPPHIAPASASLEGSLLGSVASDVQCQPCVSRALIRSPPEPSCAAGLAVCCHTAASLFHRQAAKFQPLEGPCEFGSLKQAHLLAAFPPFPNCEVETKAFPAQRGACRCSRLRSLTRSQPLPRSRLAPWPLVFDFKTVSSSSVVLKAGLCSRWGGERVKSWTGPKLPPRLPSQVNGKTGLQKPGGAAGGRDPSE